MAYKRGKAAKISKIKKVKEPTESKMPMKGYKAMMTGLMSSSKATRERI